MSNKILNSKQHQFVLVVLMASLGLVLFSQMRPYIGGFLGASTFYVILRSQMRYLVEKKGFKRSVAATLVLFEALFIFLIPLTGLGFLVADTIMGIEIDPNVIKDSVIKFVEYIEERFRIELFTPENLSFIPKLGSNIVQVVASSSYSIAINFLVILFVLYFMLYSYDSFEAAMREVLPFNAENKQSFVRETKLIIQANAFGIPLLAIVQGFFGYLGYLLMGVSSPMLYAVLTAFASIIPIVGTAVIYVPLAIGLLIQSKTGAGIGMFLYGFIVIGKIDYVARFLLQKKLADIHPLITIFGVLIGIPLFGFWGVIFGPVMLSLFVLFFNMYRHDYIEGSVAMPTVSGRIRNSGKPEKTKKQRLKKTGTEESSEEDLEL